MQTHGRGRVSETAKGSGGGAGAGGGGVGWRNGATHSGPSVGFSGSVNPVAGNRVQVTSMDTFKPMKLDFDAVRKDCLRKKALYEDPDFPADDLSLYHSRHPPYRFDWKRPHEIASQYGQKPEIFADGASRFDLKQGELGDCWVMGALASMSENMELIFRILPRGQSFKPDWYAGIFRFRFWRDGVWDEVVIDDRLPTLRGEQLFIHSNASNEFWAALLEKAYAKLYGSYEALKGGLIADALHDLTGGLTESYHLRGDNPLPRNIVNILFKALERQSLIGCSIKPIKGRQQAILHNGLVAGHSYNITDLREIRLISDHREVPITLIRIRNPWGNKIEWNGPWSERSQEWNSIPAADRTNMGLIFRDEGEFWLDFRDFLTNFDTLDICNLGIDAPVETPRKWYTQYFNGSWRKGVDAGGRPVCRGFEKGCGLAAFCKYKAFSCCRSRPNEESHWSNPQYKIILSATDEDEDTLCSFVVELVQKDKRVLRQKNPVYAEIGFVIYKSFKEFPVPLPRQYFDKYTFVERCDYFSNTRQIVKRFLMPPGEYVIIPSTYKANTEADFSLRVFFEKDNKIVYVEDSVDLLDPGPAPVDPQLKEKEETFKRFFYDVAGENMVIDAYQFRKLLNMVLAKDPGHRDLTVDTCKTLLCLVDAESIGKLGYHEFIYLWNFVQSWKRTFNAHDTSNIGHLDAYQFRAALLSLGYRLSCGVINKLIFRYADDKLNIDLDSFIRCMSRLLKLCFVYKAHKKNGTAVFTLDEFLEQTLVI